MEKKDECDLISDNDPTLFQISLVCLLSVPGNFNAAEFGYVIPWSNTEVSSLAWCILAL